MGVKTKYNNSSANFGKIIREISWKGTEKEVSS